MSGLVLNPQTMQQALTSLLGATAHEEASEVDISTLDGQTLVLHGPLYIGADHICGVLQPAARARDRHLAMVPFTSIARLLVRQAATE